MLSAIDRITIWKVLDLPQSEIPTINTLLDNVETIGIELETEVLETLTNIKATRKALANQSDKQAGLEDADVLGFNPVIRLCQIRGGRVALKRELARLIDYPLPDLRITAF